VAAKTANAPSSRDRREPEDFIATTLRTKKRGGFFVDSGIGFDATAHGFRKPRPPPDDGVKKLRACRLSPRHDNPWKSGS
jgi:hypothetical protein